MKFSKQLFEAAKKLLRDIDTECDCRMWNKNGNNDEAYGKVKGAVRDWR